MPWDFDASPMSRGFCSPGRGRRERAGSLLIGATRSATVRSRYLCPATSPTAMRSTRAFPPPRFSLVDRGFVAAIAHVRGGTDKGWRWYEDGKLARKPNTFSDFLAAARHLIAEGYTGAGRIVAQGGSAGGLLMGVVANEAPELFAGIVADVPFVDALATMMDETLPLTPPEWLEWGDPIRDPRRSPPSAATAPTTTSARIPIRRSWRSPA